MSEIYELNCPHCDRAYRLSRDKIEANAGKQIKCRACGQPFVLPGVESAEVEPEPVAVESEPVPVESADHSMREAGPYDDASSNPPVAYEPASETDGEDQTAYAASHTDAIAEPAPAVEYEPDPAPPTRSSRRTAPIAPPPVFGGSAPAVPSSSGASAPPEPAAQVIYAMPPQTVEDLSTMRKMMSLWNILLVVMLVLQLISAGSLLWIAVRLFR